MYVTQTVWSCLPSPLISKPTYLNLIASYSKQAKINTIIESINIYKLEELFFLFNILWRIGIGGELNQI